MEGETRHREPIFIYKYVNVKWGCWLVFVSHTLHRVEWRGFVIFFSLNISSIWKN